VNFYLSGLSQSESENSASVDSEGGLIGSHLEKLFDQIRRLFEVGRFRFPLFRDESQDILV